MKAAAGLPRPGPNRYPIVTYLLNETPVTINDNGAIVKGAFKLSGAEVGDFSLENLTVDAAGQGIFIELDSAEGVTAGDVTVKMSLYNFIEKRGDLYN